MKSRYRWVLGWMLVWSGATSAAAQLRDAHVLVPGQIRLQAGGVYTGVSARFGPEGDRQPLGSELAQPLTASAFAPLRPLASDLGRFLAETGAPASVASLSLGTPDLRVFQSQVQVPLELSVGVLPRVELGATVPLGRGEQLLERFSLAGGTVGINTRPQENEALLRAIGGQWAALGRSPLLPTDSSALGLELQRRVRALSGGRSLTLPRAAADTTALQQLLLGSLGLLPVRSRLEQWRPGDAEIHARALVLSNMGTGAVPPDSASGVRFRSAATLRLRLPTGREPDSVSLFPALVAVGRSGLAGSLDTDLFVGPRFWATVGLAAAAQGAVEARRRLAPADAPLSVADSAQGVRVLPGRAVELFLAPRFRLIDAIAVGLEYSGAWVAETRLEPRAGGGEAVALGGGALHEIGFAVRFSALPAVAARSASLPLEVGLGYRRVLAGPAGSADAGTVTLSGRLLPRLWGRPRPPAPPQP